MAARLMKVGMPKMPILRLKSVAMATSFERSPNQYSIYQTLAQFYQS